MSRDYAYLFDILDSARAAMSYAGGKTWKQFSTDHLLQDAIVRRLEIIGKASGRISAETQKKYPQLPWQEMKGMCNRIIHEYDSIELDIIWDIIQKDLPILVSELEKTIPVE